MNKVALHGAYHPNNYGDVLILKIQSNWIREFEQSEIILPYATKVYRDEIKPLEFKGVEGIKKSQRLVYGAGGYLGEPLVDKWKWGFNFFRKHFVPAECAIANNIKYAVIGTGVGPITNIFTRKEVIRICRKASVIAVRDTESKQYLVKYGIPENKVNVTADVALSLTIDDIPKQSLVNIDNLMSKYKGKKYGIHIAVDKDSATYGKQVEILLEEIVKFLEENSEIIPVLIIDNNNNNKQSKAVEYLKSKINRKCIVYKHENIWDTTALLSKLDIVLTNKLHVGIVSYALGTKCIAVPYHPKTKRFYKQIQQEKLCIPLLDIKNNNIYMSLCNTLNEEWRISVDKKREEVYPQLRKQALKNKELLFEFLKN